MYVEIFWLVWIVYFLRCHHRLLDVRVSFHLQRIIRPICFYLRNASSAQYTSTSIIADQVLEN